MRNFNTFFFTLLFVSPLCAQQTIPPFTPDTLIQEHFEVDPESSMIPVPTGNDAEWVNFDQDKKITFEGQPGNWYSESDLADSLSGNNCFTSVSYFNPPGRNKNWLILPPLFIPDSNYWLCWRSQPLEGPAFMDGYSVLVSTASNIPSNGDFKDPLFRAAETLGGSNSGSLNPDDYIFSSGYVHANKFTKTDYFFVTSKINPNGLISYYFRCKLEPHSVSLSKYINKTVYIAFLHDSNDDNTLQLDDIVIAKNTISSAPDISNVLSFNILNNPVQDALYLTWKINAPEEHHLTLTGPEGQVMLHKNFEPSDEGIWHFDTSSLPSGVYYCTLQTQHGQLTKRWIKI